MASGTPTAMACTWQGRGAISRARTCSGGVMAKVLNSRSRLRCAVNKVSLRLRHRFASLKEEEADGFAFRSLCNSLASPDEARRSA